MARNKKEDLEHSARLAREIADDLARNAVVLLQVAAGLMHGDFPDTADRCEEGAGKLAAALLVEADARRKLAEYEPDAGEG